MTVNRLQATRAANDITTPGTHWTDRHNAAVNNPRGFERAIVRLFQALETVAESYTAMSRQNGDTADVIGDDGYASSEFADMCKSLIRLLSMDIGRLDGGTVDGAIRKLATDNGIESEEL